MIIYKKFLNYLSFADNATLYPLTFKLLISLNNMY